MNFWERLRMSGTHTKRHLRLMLLTVAIMLLYVDAGNIFAQEQSVIRYGSTVTGEVLSRAGEEQLFYGCADDAVSILAESDEFDVVVELYGPSGRRPIAVSDIDEDTGGALIEEFTLPESGDYVILTTGSTRTDTGPYSLELDVAGRNRRDVIDLHYGESVTGAVISIRGEEWSFWGCEGDSITIAMDDADFDAYLELYAPTGRRPLAEANERSRSGAERIDSLVLPETGLYTVVAAGNSRTDRGEYTLNLTLATNTAGIAAATLPTLAPTSTSAATPTRTPTPRPTSTPGTTAAQQPVTSSNETASEGALTCRIIVDALNIRSGPGLNAARKGALVRNTPVTVLGQSADAAWLHVQVQGTSEQGWISGSERYVACGQDASSAPITVAETVSTAPATPQNTAPQPTATPTSVPISIPASGMPAPVAVDYSKDSNTFYWRWEGMPLMSSVEHWYFDVKIFNNEFSEFPYDVKVAEVENVKPADANVWTFHKPTGFRCGSYWAVQIAKRNADGSYAGPMSPESNRIPTNLGCTEPGGGGGGASQPDDDYDPDPPADDNAGDDDCGPECG